MMYLYVSLAIGILAVASLHIYNRVRKSASAGQPRQPGRDELDFEVAPAELGRRITVEEVEQLEMVDDPMHAAPRLPFGHLNHIWVQFKAVLEPGMELHTFSATYRAWGGYIELTKRGYVIVIDGVPGRYHLAEVLSELAGDGPDPHNEAFARFAQRSND